MNVILLTCIIFILALVHGGQGGSSMTSNLAPKRSQPCKNKSSMKAYNNFTRKHILQCDFDTNSKDAWKKYLNESGLCGRVPVQSFINKADEENVLQICSSAGRRLQKDDENKGNLCISKSSMTVHDVHSNKSCSFVSVKERNHRVIVACNKIGNQCLPVHYEKYNNQTPSNESCKLKLSVKLC